jgi:PST family polysaccharide transporter
MEPVPVGKVSSYGQILRSSSIAGGAQAVSLVLGMVRNKLVALILGPTGVGLIGLYDSVISTVGTLSGLGVGASGVRQVAEAHGSGDNVRLGRTAKALRRISWATGLLGLLLMVVLSQPLSQWAFGGRGHATSIAILGLALLFSALANGYTALVRGTRRIGDLARMQILSSLAGLVISVGLYTGLGERGIVPVLLVSAILSLGFAGWFARRIELAQVVLDWRSTLQEAWGFVRLGLAFVLSGLIVAGVGLTTRAWILRDLGIQANGLYQAAWSISGAFAGFVLAAMGMDFYPRLTAVAKDHNAVNRLVSEQTEVGMLLALPGLLATIVFSPWIIRLLFSQEFREAADLLPWFALGILGRVISWPLGFIQLAKGAAAWFVATEMVFNGLHLLFIWLGLRWLGLLGVAVAFTALYAWYTLGMLWVARRLTGFAWPSAVRRLLVETALAVIVTLLVVRCAPMNVSGALGAALVMATGFLCVRRICDRLGPGHRVSKLFGPIFLRRESRGG